MSELILTIKELAHQVAEDYLLTKQGMNDALVQLFRNGNIENDEVLKRICEHANQNVYLALFNDPETNKSNIMFDMADSSEVLSEAQKNEDSMRNYDTPPEDFRSSGMEMILIPKSSKEESDSEKIASINTAVEYRQVLRNFLSSIETMKVASEYSAENAYGQMAHDVKILISKGESIGDISKIATRYVKDDLEGDFMKTAKCYDLIHEDLKKEGFRIKTEFTKISSQRINTKSDVLRPVYEFAASIAKIAGFTEMQENLKSVISVFNKNIKETQV